MDSLFNFIFEKHNLPVLVDDDNKYWFQGLVVGEILEYSNIRKALNVHIPTKYKKQYSQLRDDKKMHGQTTFINESGLYRLIMKSEQEKAVEFQEWITDVVLPELREKGVYKMDEISKKVTLLLDKYKKIKEENKVLKNLLNKNKHARHGIVYVKKSETINNKITYKIGSTEHSDNRENTYITGHLITSEYVFYIETDNYKLVENLIKEKLYKYRINSTTEIFDVSLDSIKKVFNKVKEFTDLTLDEDIHSVTETDSDTEILTDIHKTIKPITTSISNEKKKRVVRKKAIKKDSVSDDE